MNPEPSAPSLHDININHFTWLKLTYGLCDDQINNLGNIINTCNIIVVCDDSYSMNFPFEETTAWSELKNIVKELLVILAAPIDIYSFNYQPLYQINNQILIEPFLNRIPNARGQLENILNQIYTDYLQSPRKLLLIILSDSYLSNSSSFVTTCLSLLQYPQIYISYVDCGPYVSSIAAIHHPKLYYVSLHQYYSFSRSPSDVILSVLFNPLRHTIPDPHTLSQSSCCLIL